MKGYVYILLMGDERYYVGSTDNIERRIKEHQIGKVDATKVFQPLKLLFSREYDDLSKARKVEKLLKQQKSKNIIKKFMSSEWQDQW